MRTHSKASAISKPSPIALKLVDCELLQKDVRLFKDTFLNLRRDDGEQLFRWVRMGIMVKKIPTFMPSPSIAWTACIV